MSTINLKYEDIAKDIAGILYEKGAEKDSNGKWHGEHKAYNGYVPDPMPPELWSYLLVIAHDSYIAGAQRVITEWNKKEDAAVRKAQNRALDKIRSGKLK